MKNMLNEYSEKRATSTLTENPKVKTTSYMTRRNVPTKTWNTMPKLLKCTNCFLNMQMNQQYKVSRANFRKPHTSYHCEITLWHIFLSFPCNIFGIFTENFAKQTKIIISTFRVLEPYSLPYHFCATPIEPYATLKNVYLIFMPYLPSFLNMNMNCINISL